MRDLNLRSIGFIGLLLINDWYSNEFLIFIALQMIFYHFYNYFVFKQIKLADGCFIYFFIIFWSIIIEPTSVYFLLKFLVTLFIIYSLDYLICCFYTIKK